MSRSFRLSLLLTPLTLCAISASSQTAPVATAPLREIRTEGLKSLSKPQAAVEHQVVANPIGDGTVQQFRINAEALHIASLQFSDPALNTSLAVQQQLPDLLGKPYSRTAVDLFLTEQIRPTFLQKGFLRAKLGPPEVLLSGNPNQKIPEKIPVYLPIDPGPAYHWKSPEWIGNNLLSTITLTNTVGLKSGDVAHGMAIAAAWDRVREEYGTRCYLLAKVDPTPT